MRASFKILKKQDDIILIESIEASKVYYRVIYKFKPRRCIFGSVMFSYYRSLSQASATHVFNATKSNVSKVMKCFKGKNKKQIPSLLKEVVYLSLKHEKWKPSHIAAQMNASYFFSTKNSTLMRDINKNQASKTCLHVALATQNFAIVRSILSLRPDLSLTDADGNTAVHFAAMTNIDIFKLVMSNPYAKDLITKKNKHGCTPLHLACYTNKPDIVFEFLKMDLTVEDLTISPPEPESKSFETIKQTAMKQKRQTYFHQQLIDDMAGQDIVFGGSPLHWTTTRRSLESLIQMGFDVNSRNMAEETPLHVHIKRRRLKCVISLLCNEKTDIELRSLDGDTPLHEAVKQLDIPAVQTLMVFDADLNAQNNKKETPRHLAAMHNTQINNIALYALHFLGAKRCDRDMQNCTPGCAFDGNFNGTPYAKWSTFEDETLYKRILFKPIIQNALKRKREKLQSKRKKVALLCFDGGGIRGLIGAQILIELQKYFELPIIDHFQWVAGTSTGALLGSLLSVGKEPRQIRRIYFAFKNKILHGPIPYSSTAFENAIKANIDENLTMSDIKNVKLIIPVTLADRHPAQLHLFRSYESPAEICGMTKGLFNRVPNHKEMKLWAACRASGSAPVYFNPFGPYIDGGVISNNPTLDALSEFVFHNEALKFSNRENEIEELGIVVSIGCGKIPVTLRDPLRNVAKIASLNPAESYRNAMIVKDILMMILEQATGTDAHFVHRAQAWCRSINVPYFRINPPVSETVPLDMTEDEEIINLMWETKAYMRAVHDQLKDMIELLTMPNETTNIIRKESKAKSETKTIILTPKSKREMIQDFEYDFKLQDTLMIK
ncbi:85 kDa calcium-independent phospholipase A2-like protein [Dinothrombium tinctorium]|uniref:phospholipase A2 n=1 Tax=Dinothrombium tinctorium TaxID=1965070 RepID=A0A3S3P3J3_9ACAR|nr:85 kDa calcium-independent phospholipase A2-like protein [Dinothrombium tinctorium]